MSAAEGFATRLADRAIGKLEEPSTELRVRIIRASGNLASVQVRKLAGEDTSGLDLALTSSFANLQAEGSIEAAAAVRDALGELVTESVAAVAKLLL